jgi:solute carrier family 25 (mitochondrial citrate transporter), member 1
MPLFKRDLNPVVAASSGAIAGGIELTLLWPFEYCKTILQLRRNEQHLVKAHKYIYNNAMRQIENFGPLGLYRGYIPVLSCAIPKAAVRFGSYHLYQSVIIKFIKDTEDPLVGFYSGFLAGATEAILVVVPQETLKTKMIELNLGFRGGLKHAMKNGGIASLYDGFVPTVMKQSTNQAIHFSVYGLYRNLITTNNNQSAFTTIDALYGGLLAGTCSVCTNNPIDVVKTRMQSFSAHEYSSTSDCFKKILTNEGPSAFYKGLFSRLLRVVPGQGIMFVTYETFVKLLE